MKQSPNKEIVRTWMCGKNKTSTTLVIPKQFAEWADIMPPCNIVIEKREDGLLIRKLNI